MASRRRFPLGLLVLLLLGGAAVAYFGFGVGRPRGDEDLPSLHTVARGPLRVTVLESGSLEALSSTTIASQVEGQAAIIFLIPEGTILTADDVAARRELVRLDGSELETKIRKQESDVASARASTVNAQESLVIQKKEDASKERQAILQVEFARMDLRRALGDTLGARLEEQRRTLDAARARVAAAEALRAGTVEGARGPSEAELPDLRRAVAELELAQAQMVRGLLEDPQLSGETLQKLRQLRSDISLADEELKRAQVKWDWSKKLLEKDYVSRDEEDADRLAFERRKIEKERAETAHAQYVTYDYPKVALKLLSDLVEADGELARVRDRARAAQNRAESELSSRRQLQSLQEEQLRKYEEQRAACVIRATRPGLVLYASSTGERSYDDNQRIREGGSVRQRQAILVMPDTDKMGVRLNVHESVVEKVRVGQRVTVTVDAAPDRPLAGVVDSVKDVPNATDRWMNPDLKVYATMVRLEATTTPLRPGMSAKAEILVEELADVVSVPVQSIAGAIGRPAVTVWDGVRATERTVTLGSTNDRFVQITSGNLAAGERVLLAPRRSAPADGPAKGPDGRENGPRGTPPATGPAGGGATAPLPRGSEPAPAAAPGPAGPGRRGRSAEGGGGRAR